jgi:hypothetical protein
MGPQIVFSGQFEQFVTLIRVNRIRKIAFMGLLLAASIATRSQSTDVNKPTLTDRGQVTGLTYSNATLGFSYQFSQGFLVNPDNLPLGAFILAISDKHNGTPWRDRIVPADSGKYSGATSDYVTHFARSMPNIVVLRETRSFKVTGRDFFVSISRRLRKVRPCIRTLYADSLVSWAFASLNKQQAEEMATSINSVAFASAKAH